MQQPLFLDLRDVSYQVNGQRILDRATWQVAPGQHWAILGPNGAGKTTLLRIACGYLWPNAGGEVYRNGQRWTDLRVLRRSIGWVTSTLASQIREDEPVINTIVSGRFAALGLKRLGWEQPTQDDLAQAGVFLERFKIAHLADRHFGVLSEGERQRTLLARALMARPMLVILDEPCAGLDPVSRQSFLAAVQSLATSDDTTSLVLVTHHVEEIMPAFANTLVMHNGRITHSGTTRQVLTAETLNELYGDSITKVEWSGGRCWPIGR